MRGETLPQSDHRLARSARSGEEQVIMITCADIGACPLADPPGGCTAVRSARLVSRGARDGHA